MKRPYLLASVGIAAMVAAGPAQAAAPLLILGLVAAGVVGMAVVASEEASSPEQTSSIPKTARRTVGETSRRAASAAPAVPDRHEVWRYTDKHGWVGGAHEDVATIDTPLAPKRGTSRRLVSACRDAIAKTAEPYDVASLEAVSAGRQVRVNGRVVAPIEVRAVYRVRGVHEVKRSTVRCQVDRTGRVIATS